MLIYVEEQSLDKEVPFKVNSTSAIMNETKYAELYYPISLEMLMKEGKHGDAIGQGRWMISYIISREPCPGEQPILYLKEHPEILV